MTDSATPSGPDKTGEKSGLTLVPQKHGGALRRGSQKGGKGGTGRPAEIYVKLCAELITSDACQQAVLEIIRNPDHASFVPLYRVLSDRAFGKVTEKIDLNANVSARVSHEPLTILLPKLDPRVATPNTLAALDTVPQGGLYGAPEHG